MLRLTQGFVFLFSLGVGDQYLQNPKGSNNRLNEKSANRNNANRLFDSQNNNRGGYNVGETGEAGQAFNQNDFGEGTPEEMYDVGQQTNNQYDLIYQEESQLRLTWTSQHGCGNPMNNCNMVIQFGCDTYDALGDQDNDADLNNDNLSQGLGIRMGLHNGGNTNTPDETNNFNNVAGTFQNNNNNNRGRHESEEFYAFCRNRQRDTGLFLADQKLKGNTQKYTRQNPNGNRRGLECPEERDYYPWPHPSPWRDLFWVGHDYEYCKTNIAPLSENLVAKGSCAGSGGVHDLPTNDQGAQVTEAGCQAEGGTWVTNTWGIMEDTEAQFINNFCQDSKWTQVNHLGNADGTTLGGQMNSIMWNIPSVDDLVNTWKCHQYTDTIGTTTDGTTGNTNTIQYVRGVIRTRYNISTGDYDQYNTFSDQNNDPGNGVISPVTQNPTIDVGAYMQGLRLALNTAQTGRTFQDRSHVFTIMKKRTSMPAAQRNYATLNVNVRGKRGNIVQTFPAMEYDFEPNDFKMSREQCIHLQWTGSNTHNNGNPAGDGQAGDAGEGAGGTDRSNLMEMKSLRKNFPMAYDKEAAAGSAGTESFFDQVDCKYPMDATDRWITDKDFVKAIFATAGYYYYDDANRNELKSVDDDNAVNVLLNNVSASFKQGLVCCTNSNSKAGTYYFQSTRNNNFSNRSQKMRIQIEANTDSEFEFYPAAF